MSDAAPTPAEPVNAFGRPGALPWVLVAATAIAMVVALRAMGRVWWCACGRAVPWSFDVASSHNSQHLVDPYAISHLLHGMLFFGAVTWVWPRMTLAWRLWISVCVEVAWEVIENTPLIINRYRDGTAAMGYEGDSVVNAGGDLLSAVAGFWLARAIGWRWSLAVFVAAELLMLAWIRDNLTLNVVMLLWPMDAVRTWQGNLSAPG